MAPHPVTPRRPEGGFTLIEVMIAILLTALTVIGVLGLFKVETRASSTSRRDTEAAVLAQDKLEELRTFAVPTTGGSENLIDAWGREIFTRTWTVTPAADVTTIRVVVEWEEDGYMRRVTVNGVRGSS